MTDTPLNTDDDFQTVTDTDGTIHRFPSNATPEQIYKALGKTPPVAATANTTNYSPPTTLDAPSTPAYQGASPNGLDLLSRYAAENPAATWQNFGFGKEAVGATALGAAPYIRAGVRTGAQLLTNTPGDFSGNLSAEQAAQAAWEQEHPNEKAVSDIIGSALPLSAAARAGSNLITSGVRLASPALADFLQGTSGYTAGGQPLAGAGNLGLRLASQGARGGLEGLIASGAGSQLSDMPIGEQMAIGTGAGFGLGAVVGPAANYIRNAIRGEAVSPEVAQLAEKWGSQYGIPIGAGQVRGTVAATPEMRQAFTREFASTFGEDVGTGGITNDVMDRAGTRIGSTLDQLEARMQMKRGQNYFTQLNGVRSDIGLANISPARQTQLNALVERAENALPGDYKALAGRGSDLDKLISGSADPATRNIAKDIRGVLQDALINGSSPDDVTAYAQARQQWKNFKIADKIQPKAGPDGIIDPGWLSPTVVKRSYPGFARTGTPGTPALSDLVRGTNAGFFPSPPENKWNWLKWVVGPEILGSVPAAAAMHYLAHDPLTSIGTAAAAGGVGLAARAAKYYLNKPPALSSLVRMSTGQTPALTVPTAPGAEAAVQLTPH